MASHETLLSKILRKPSDDVDHHVFDDDHDHEHEHNQIHSHAHNLSRLSVCSSSFMSTNDEDDHDGRVHDVDTEYGHAHDEFDDDYSHDEWNGTYANGMRMFMSRLSIESFDGDVDEEISDENYGEDLAEMSADSSDEQECYSLPATPPRGRGTRAEAAKRTELGVKDYASENEAQKGVFEKRNRKNSRRRIIRERWGGNGNRKSIGGQSGNNILWSNCNSFSGESEGSGGCGGGSGSGSGLLPVVITRPKGGRRSLCMDLEEVKACRDLGFELEHERMVEIPTRKSVDTSSGGDSPIANWRISSPGDDPRDVKARLKVWAQAVALASSSSLSSN